MEPQPCRTCSRDFSLNPIREVLEQQKIREAVKITLRHQKGKSVADLGTSTRELRGSFNRIPRYKRLNPGRRGFSDPAKGCGYQLVISSAQTGRTLLQREVCPILK